MKRLTQKKNVNNYLKHWFQTLLKPTTLKHYTGVNYFGNSYWNCISFCFFILKTKDHYHKTWNIWLSWSELIFNNGKTKANKVPQSQTNFAVYCKSWIRRFYITTIHSGNKSHLYAKHIALYFEKKFRVYTEIYPLTFQN